MSEETKNAEQIEQDAKDSELSEQALDNVAGGGFPYKPLPPIVIPFKPMPVDDPPIKPLKL